MSEGTLCLSSDGGLTLQTLTPQHRVGDPPASLGQCITLHGLCQGGGTTLASRVDPNSERGSAFPGHGASAQTPAVDLQSACFAITASHGTFLPAKELESQPGAWDKGALLMGLVGHSEAVGPIGHDVAANGWQCFAGWGQHLQGAGSTLDPHGLSWLQFVAAETPGLEGEWLWSLLPNGALQLRSCPPAPDSRLPLIGSPSVRGKDPQWRTHR